MKKYRTISALFVLFIIWEFLAIQIDNDFLFPYPLDVIALMGKQVMTASFYSTLGITLVRSLSGLCIAFILAFLCAFLSYKSNVFKDLFYPVLLLTRSVPNISYIIIVLVWFGRDRSASIVSFLIIFPTIYSSLFQGFLHIQQNLKNVLRLYPTKKSYQIWYVYIPLLQSAMQASLSNGISLAFKVGVMAEIIGQVQTGVGRQLNLCRLNSDMTGIFAWTGWIILVLLFMEGMQHVLFQKKNASETTH
ncbi:MAG: ABC transporter permease subunit [Longicatena sp.]